MTRIERSALVMHTAGQMFDLVNDVQAYPDFLPWCASSEVIEQTDSGMLATLHLAKGGLKYSFTTRNELSPPDEIRISLAEGPFSSLTGVWKFIPLSDEACKVTLDMEFDFANKLTGLAMGKVFSQIAATLVDAFVKRADQVYN